MTTTQTQPTTVTTTQQRRSLVVPGVAAAAAAAASTTLVAAVAGAIGVDFELPDGGESIPLLGFTQLTFMFALVGVALAAGLRRWSSRPARTFVRITVALTAVSLVPPFLVDANIATSASLVLLHLIAAAIVIPTIASRLSD